MKLSIVILCWNDLRVIQECLRSIYETTRELEFEVVVSDNGSSDGTLEFISNRYPQVQVVANCSNLGFAAGNNAGIAVCKGQYIVILNPDTIIHENAFQKWVAFADRHPEAGAFGCRVVNPDGTYQGPARPFPTVWRDWVAALYMRSLARLSNAFVSDTYTGWKGNSERPIDWQSGCCVMFRAQLLKRLGGFDAQFFYHFEEVDLCRRVWDAGFSILYTPEPVVTHLGGQSVSRFPIRFELEKCRSRYRYFYKHFGPAGAKRCRRVALARIMVRQLGWGVLGRISPSETIKARMEMYHVTAEWNKKLDPLRFVERGEEPNVARISPVPASGNSALNS